MKRGLKPSRHSGHTIPDFWSLHPDDLFQKLETSINGLSSIQAVQKQIQHKGEIPSALFRNVLLLVSQFKSPISLLLLFALLVSAYFGELANAGIIFTILLLSGLLGFIQERRAGKAGARLRSLVQTLCRVKRDGQIVELPIDEIVPGDLFLLRAGDIVPADGLLLELEDLYVNESALTGESFPSEKKTGILAEDTPLIGRLNSVFKGTSVISGTATALAVETGKESLFGTIESRTEADHNKTAFEKGINRFGFMLMRIALIMAGLILLFNILSGKAVLDSWLFALSLSLGLTPEMLPAIVTITLSAGANRLARQKVIVKKLASIQNLGAIDILCSDKTGTLTEGEISVHAYCASHQKEFPKIRLYAYLNAMFESGYSNPMDEALRKQSSLDTSAYSKLDEVPYDFIRKRLSVVASNEGKHIMITKGAVKNILEVCTQIEHPDGTIVPLAPHLEKLQQDLQTYSAQGLRTIGICYKDVTGDPVITKEDESEMTFIGFVLLSDPVKKDAIEVVEELRRKQVTLKIITGDNTLIAEHIAGQLGIPNHRILSGKEIERLKEEELVAKMNEVDLFSETDPHQKEIIVRALQAAGHVVGYLGDGINDAAALKAADVGISVNSGVDIAKESADMILLDKKLSVISQGITEGRKTYLNTLKYIFITISANFGNMFSMAGASLFLPFLPLLPAQILLTNFITDLPALAIASDKVDEELLSKPRKWDVGFIQRFMLVFGLESSIFDYLTFGALLYVFHANAETFRTAWFIESCLTEVIILLIIRTRRSFYKSPVGRWLILSSLSVLFLVLGIPYLPYANTLGLEPLPQKIILAMLAIAGLYAIVGELTKKMLFRKMNF